MTTANAKAVAWCLTDHLSKHERYQASHIINDLRVLFPEFNWSISENDHTRINFTVTPKNPPLDSP